MSRGIPFHKPRIATGFNLEKAQNNLAKSKKQSRADKATDLTQKIKQLQRDMDHATDQANAKTFRRKIHNCALQLAVLVLGRDIIGPDLYDVFRNDNPELKLASSSVILKQSGGDPLTPWTNALKNAGLSR